MVIFYDYDIGLGIVFGFHYYFESIPKTFSSKDICHIQRVEPCTCVQIVQIFLKNVYLNLKKWESI